MINGVINVYKEKGFTSHDVVAKLRGILRQKKSVIPERWTRMRKVSFQSALEKEPSCAVCLRISGKHMRRFCSLELRRIHRIFRVL